MTSQSPGPVPIPPIEAVFLDDGLRRAAIAAERGDVAAIRALGPIDLNATSHFGANLLMYELARRDETAVRTLIDAGADPNHITEDFASPMMAAGISGDPRWLHLLIDKGGDPDLKHGGEPLITVLVPYGQFDGILALLDRGAKIDATGPSGQTAAFRFAALYQYDRVYALLERGADPARADESGLTLAAFVVHPVPEGSPQEAWRLKVAERIGLTTPPGGAPAS